MSFDIILMNGPMHNMFIRLRKPLPELLIPLHGQLNKGITYARYVSSRTSYKKKLVYTFDSTVEGNTDASSTEERPGKWDGSEPEAA